MEVEAGGGGDGNGGAAKEARWAAVADVFREEIGSAFFFFFFVSTTFGFSCSRAATLRLHGPWTVGHTLDHSIIHQISFFTHLDFASDGSDSISGASNGQFLSDDVVQSVVGKLYFFFTTLDASRG